MTEWIAAWLVLLWIICACNFIALDLRLRREAKRLNKAIDELAGLRANVLYKGEKHAQALMMIDRRLEAVETLAKRRTRR